MGDPGPAGAPNRNLGIVGELLKQSPTADVFQSVLAQAPGDRQENLNRLLAIGIVGYGREDHAFREELVYQMTKEECFAAFESLTYIPNREFFDRMLTNFGYTDEEVARLLRKEESP